MIKRIKICDFKSIRELEVTLDPVTVLVGRSGSGKSNFVQAIRFLRNLLLNHESAINYERGWNHIVPVGEKNPKTHIEVSFSVPGDELEYTYRVTLGGVHGQPQVTGERLTVGRDVEFSRSKAMSDSWSWDVPPKVAAVPHPVDSPMLGSFPSLEKVSLAYAALSTGIGYYHFPPSTLDPYRPPSEHAHLHEFLRSIPGLSDNASNFSEVIRGIIQDFHRPTLRKSLLATLKKVNPDVVAVDLDSLRGSGKVIVGHTAGGKIFELALEQESDGFRRFYAHLLALYQSPPKLTMVFEEPENAIFPGALSLLADEFKAASLENRGQVILTTHSPMLLDSFEVENVRVVEMKNGKTVIGPVSKEQRDAVKDHLLTTGELLTTDPARIDEGRPAAQPA